METRSPSAAERWLEFIDPKRSKTHVYAGCLWQWEDVRWVNLTERREFEARLTEGVRLDSETLLSDGQREERIYDATPDWHEFKKQFPKADVIEHEDGTKTADLKHLSLEQKMRLGEMYGERRKLEVEKSEDLSSRREG